MPRGKEFCLLESEFFKVAEFKTVDGTRLHNVDPLHRIDGILVRIENGKVIEISDFDLESAAADVLPDDA